MTYSSRLSSGRAPSPDRKFGHKSKCWHLSIPSRRSLALDCLLQKLRPLRVSILIGCKSALSVTHFLLAAASRRNSRRYCQCQLLKDHVARQPMKRIVPAHHADASSNLHILHKFVDEAPRNDPSNIQERELLQR